MKKQSILIIIIFLFVVGCSSDESNNKGNNINDDYIMIEPKTTYKCKNNDELVNNNCIKIISQEPETTKNCSNGYTLSKDTCIKKEKVEPGITKYCKSNNSILNMQIEYENGHCKVTTKMHPLNCNDKICIYYDGNGNIIPTISFIVYDQKYVCNEGYIMYPYDNNWCYKTYIDDSYIMKSYTCYGELIGEECIIENKEKPIIKQVCNNGYKLKENKCIKEENYEAQKILSCDVDFSLKNEKCIKLKK